MTFPVPLSIYLFFFVFLYSFPRSRHLEILESKDANGSGIEVTRIRYEIAKIERFSGSLDVLFFSFAVATSGREFVRGRVVSICPRAICNSMQLPRAETHPRFLTRKAPLRRHERNGCRASTRTYTSFSLLVSSAYLSAFKYYSHSLTHVKFLINNFSYLSNKNSLCITDIVTILCTIVNSNVIVERKIFVVIANYGLLGLYLLS